MIKTISTSYHTANPQRATSLMQEVIKENTKLTNRVTQEYLLQDLVKKELATKDVASIEKKQREQRRNDVKKDKKMIDFLMKRKLKDTTDAVKSKRKEYKATKSKLYEEISPRPLAANAFRKLMRNNSTNLFNKTSNQMKRNWKVSR